MRRLPVILALCLVSGAASAQELHNLAACRLNAEMVTLTFSYQGGGCEKTGDASVEPSSAGTAIVTVPIVKTAEVCTMQAVDVSSASAVAVVEEVNTLDVRLVGADGTLKAEGRVEITPNSPDCKPPKLN
ncbi:hypothetical protein PRN20_09940 [Devosia sp. ZB163]|uniref:hypothetical protein n=1 Tax=Devosia sp. ZB163 TaxID=3025938 RepID=UPI00235ED0FA|nr:hypothetical protein [Devosia sp. ZB163]MDC9824057.1 hypothetical protein [Devosia sp. ZB163]